MTSSVVEDYLQVIHHMARDGIPIIAARLAERMNVTAPTVTATLQRMERDGLIVHGPHRGIELTDSGQERASTIVRRHALAERLLTDLLHMPWDESHAEAHGVEHAITDRLERRLAQALGNPTSCPHGNPIPGAGFVNPNEIPLDRVKTGDAIQIERITEEAEQDPDLMGYLEAHGVKPGARLRVREATPFNALVVLDGDLGQVALGFPVAAKLRVIRLAEVPSAA